MALVGRLRAALSRCNPGIPATALDEALRSGDAERDADTRREQPPLSPNAHRQLLGLANQLKKALAEYTDSGGKGETTIDQERAVALMLEKYEVVTASLHSFDYSRAFSDRAADRLQAGVSNWD